MVDSAKKNAVPAGVLVIAVYYFLSAGLMAVSGLFMLVWKAGVRKLFAASPAYANLTDARMSVQGLVFVAVAALVVLFGVLLIMANRAARWLGVVFSALGLVWAIYGTAFLRDWFSLFFLAINGAFLYLLLSPGAGVFYRAQKKSPAEEQDGNHHRERVQY